MKPAVALLLVAIGCGSYDELPRMCQTASPASHAVTCPGVPGCVCVDPDACCMARVDAVSGVCESPRSCNGIVLSCDGPEDCNGGVCCLTQTGSSCSMPSACQGTWLCRSDTQCAGSGASHCMPADFGQPGVKDRGLDGRIGICHD